MRRLAGAAWGAVAALSLACAQPAPPPASGKGVLEADALKLIARYDAAWAAKDVPAVEKFLAPEYVYFSSRGKVSGLAQMRAMLASPGYRIDRSHRDELRAVRHGSTVVVGSRWTGEGIFENKPFADDQRCSIVVAFADGAGRVLAEHCTAIAPESPGRAD